MIILLDPVSSNPGMYVGAYPIQILEIAGFIKKKLPGVDIRVISVPGEYGLPLHRQAKTGMYEQIATDLAALEPKGIGISVTAISQALETIALAEAIKKKLPGVFIFTGGYFSTLYPEELLQKTRAIDAVVVGQGEIPSAEIASRLERGEPAKRPKIEGVLFREDLPVEENFKPATFDLTNKAPLPAGIVRKAAADSNMLPYAFSRGCNFRCRFCMESLIRPSRKSVPPAIVEQDLLTLAESTDSRSLIASDAMFKADGVYDLIRKHGFMVNFETRCDVITPRQFEKFADICESIALGFESASFNTLKRMNKVVSKEHYDHYIENTKGLFEVAAKHRIPVMVFMIAGFPGDTDEDLRRSEDFAAFLSQYSGPGGHIFKIGECRVYPKSPLYDFALSRKDVVFDDEGVFGENVVRSSSADVTFDRIQTCISRIFALSHITERLFRVLHKMFPFFRLPPEALNDPILPDQCFSGPNRDILSTKKKSLKTFGQRAPVLLKKYERALSGPRKLRSLNL